MDTLTFKGTVTYSIYKQLRNNFVNLVSTIGDIMIFGVQVI